MNLEHKEIRKLPEELINQIAAGEVIERPASVVKELLDNAIDAGADHIKIKIKDGGMKLVEVSDNGSGISKEMLPKAFETHSTSKVSTLDDLNKLMTMGFRGEALSTIVSVSNLEAISKIDNSESAFKISFDGIEVKNIEIAARDRGTTVSVKNLFSNIPARLKFLKSADTEYRKILDVLLPYFISHPEIHFLLEKENSLVYNLPALIDPNHGDTQTLSESRIKQVLKGDFTEGMIQLFYDGGGIKISGLISHPSHHAKRIKNIYIFVNNRSVSERGIFKSVIEGYDRFIPHGEQVPFIIDIQINPELVDVNVHPRKEEVRFLNPFRVYSAVEKSVSEALSKNLKDSYIPQHNLINSDMDRNSVALNRLRVEEDFAEDQLTPQPLFKQDGQRFYQSGENSRELDFRKRSSFSEIEQSIQFSRSILQESDGTQYEVMSDENQLSGLNFITAFQMFKKYIFLELESEMWVIDQHAAAERITFEKLLNTYEVGNTDVQTLLVPTQLILDQREILYLKENQEFFKNIGFEIEVDDEKASLKSLPVEFSGSNIEDIFRSIFELSDDERNLHRNLDRAREDILATIACHTSIRTNQRLKKEECLSIVDQLLQCRNPYSCPHGRPIVWEMKLNEIDSYFDRTY